MARSRFLGVRRCRSVFAAAMLAVLSTACSERTNTISPRQANPDATLAAAAAPVLAVLDEPRVDLEATGGIEPIFEDFAAATFTNPTVIDNPWFPFAPGTHLVLTGTTVDDGETLAHRLEYIVTNLTKEILGVTTVVAWIEDYSDDELVEAEMAFYAQADDGTVWFFGEYPEEYEDEEFITAPAWIAGVEGARPGITMYADPQPGLPHYFQGWGPGVDWSDYARIDSLGDEVCIELDCYSDTLTVAESSLGEAGIFQLKSYAKGVGTIKVDFQGADLTQEQLELTGLSTITDVQMERYIAAAMAMEAHAYAISPTVYGTTPPLVVAGS